MTEDWFLPSAAYINLQRLEQSGYSNMATKVSPGWPLSSPQGFQILSERLCLPPESQALP